MQLTINVVARSVDDVDELIGNLEETGSFSNLLSVQENFNDDGAARRDRRRDVSARRTAPAAERRRRSSHDASPAGVFARSGRSSCRCSSHCWRTSPCMRWSCARLVCGRRPPPTARRPRARASPQPNAISRRPARLVAGKTLAEQELSTFYDKVLPADLSAARRMTYASLPALARRANVKYDASRSEIEPVKEQRLGAPPYQHGARGRLRRCQAIHLRARDDAGVRDYRRRDAGTERPGRAARAVPRALGVLPDGRRMATERRGRWPWARSLWCWCSCCTVHGRRSAPVRRPELIV